MAASFHSLDMDCWKCCPHVDTLSLLMCSISFNSNGVRVTVTWLLYCHVNKLKLPSNNAGSLLPVLLVSLLRGENGETFSHCVFNAFFLIYFSSTLRHTASARLVQCLTVDTRFSDAVETLSVW